MRKILIASLMLAAHCAFAAQQDISVKTPTGTLWGTLAPAASAIAAILMLPGSGPTDRNGNGPSLHPDTYELLADGLAKQRITSLRIDKRGVGESAAALSSEANLTFDTNVEDAEAWTKELKARAGFPCVWLFGHSEGTIVAELAAIRNPDVCGLILTAGPGRKAGDVIRAQIEGNPNIGADLKRAMLSALAQLEAGHAVASPPPSPLFRRSVQPYMMSWLPLDPPKLLAESSVPVLILQGDNDLQVRVAGARRLAAARAGITLTVLPGVNHVLKVAPADRAGNLATYSDPALPIAPGIIDDIVRFVSAHRK